MKCLALALVFLAVAVAEGGGPEVYERRDMLVGPLTLAEPDFARQFVILDCRPEKEYDEGHVPQARRVDHDEWAKAFGDGNDAAAWGKRIGALGIGDDTKVVVYDDKAQKEAARIWWILKYWGAGDVRLLDGGWKGWQAAGLSVSKEAPQTPEAAFHPQAQPERLAMKDDVLEVLRQKREQIVDSRSSKEFCGADLAKNKRGGAIPGAHNLDWTDLVNQETHCFKSPHELRELFKQAGIDLKKPTLTHCQSGGRASVMVFALELMGANQVRNYYRGWSEWGNLDDTPIDQPK